MSPHEAMAAGASALVIGRPILTASDPQKALDLILKDLGI
jgi:orotidine-5'-phosphate decarboxylase